MRTRIAWGDYAPRAVHFPLGIPPQSNCPRFGSLLGSLAYGEDSPPVPLPPPRGQAAGHLLRGLRVPRRLAAPVERVLIRHATWRHQKAGHKKAPDDAGAFACQRSARSKSVVRDEWRLTHVEQVVDADFEDLLVRTVGLAAVGEAIRAGSKIITSDEGKFLRTEPQVIVFRLD